jgi:ketosteroid isomerase-like protein
VSDADVRAVIEVHEEFYAAFEAQDLDRMAECWAQDDEVRCIQPGSDLVTGWPRVSRAWTALFLNSSETQFFLTDVEVTVDGDTAVVSCIENVLAGAELATGKVVSTKVFRRDGGRWLVVLNHSSPVLV